MAESVNVTLSSDSEPEGAPKKPLPKRRRLLTTSTSIPVYSTQVENSLRFLKNPLKLPDKIKARCNNKLAYSSEEDEDEEKPVPLKQLKSKPRFQFSSARLSRKAEFKPLLCLFSFWQMSRPFMFSFTSSTAREGSCQSPIRNWYFWK